MNPSITDVCKKQFFMSFEMLAKLPEYCPDELWYKKKSGVAFWYILYHVLSGVRYWMRLKPGELRNPFPGKNLYPDFEKEPEQTLSKEEINQYIESVKIACEDFFNIMTNTQLQDKSFLTDSFTNLDIILLLMRHIQYHVGQCNTILKENNQKTVAWIE